MKLFATILVAVIALQAVLVNGSSQTCINDLHTAIASRTDLSQVVYVSLQLAIPESVLLIGGAAVPALLVAVTAYQSQLVLAVQIVVTYIAQIGVTFNHASVTTAINNIQSALAALVTQCGSTSPSISILLTDIANIGNSLKAFVIVINNIVNTLAVGATPLVSQVIVSLALVLQLVLFGIDACIGALAVAINILAKPAYLSLVSYSGKLVTSSTNIVTTIQSNYQHNINPVPAIKAAINIMVLIALG